ncbi:MAG: 30S ribosomal protein S8 [Nanoarchaeota archaeon]|nr:30S ribosomal protein S8 [Nanoarchaeota archaeon]
MVQYDHLANLLNHLVNNKKVRKYKCEFKPLNKLVVAVLEVMKKNGYIKDFLVKKDSTGGVLEIEIGNLNLCRAIKPRFNVKGDSYDKYIRRFLPSRNLGIIIVSTNKGLLTHREAIEKGVGGKLIAYCY